MGVKAPSDKNFRRAKVHMALDPEVDAAYPARWIGKVTVLLRGGQVLHGRVDEPKGDPGNTLTRTEIEDKAARLAAFSGAASQAEVRALADFSWRLADCASIGRLLPRKDRP